jgi:hypothetical protein
VLHCRAMTRLLIFGLLLSLIGCDLPDRVGRLEKENKELKVTESERKRVVSYDLQAKCAKDAREYFDRGWRPDKNTVLLDFKDHYNKSENRCFILIEYHYNVELAAPGRTSWTNLMNIYDVQENNEYAEFGENHYSYSKPKFTTGDEVVLCKVQGQECKSIDEFNKLSSSLMND